MSMNRLMNLIDAIIDDAKAAVLATVDKQGMPQLRWVTPGTISDRPGSLFIISAHNFAKVDQARNSPGASILLQTRLLDKVLNLQGVLSVLENPSIRSETLERVGKRLNAFWKIGTSDRELVVLEFTVTLAALYLPQVGSKEIITIDGRKP